MYTSIISTINSTNDIIIIIATNGTKVVLRFRYFFLIFLKFVRCTSY